MPDLGRWLIYAGGFLLVLGLIVSLLGSVLPLGRLPGDIRFSRGNVTFFAPLGTMLLLSVLLTIIANVVIRILNR